MMKQTQQLTELMRTAVQSFDCELWGIHWQNGQHPLLRVYIDKPSGQVCIQDCEKVSNQLSTLLDVEANFTHPYTLEVSSPGLARPLFTPAQFIRYMGCEVKVTTKIALDGRKNFSGTLTHADEQHIHINTADGTAHIDMTNLHKANLKPTVLSQ